MANLTPLNFNPAQVEDVGEGGFRVIPPGTYNVMIVSSTINDTKSSTGKILELQYQIIEGSEVGSTIIDRLNIVNQKR